MMEKLVEAIKADLAGHERVLLAISGGQDSMALLDLLLVSRETLGIELGLAHVNHGQRPESDEEEAYLRQLATYLDLPLSVSHFSGEFSEKKARDFRYAFFKQVMVEQGYTALLTAHHQDDQVETILMRLLRGGRLRHLTGIQAVQPFGPGQLIRPLLGVKKADLPQVFHFEDQSNKDLTYFRNRVRQVHLPALTQENPKISQHLLALSSQVGQLYQALGDLTRGMVVTDLVQFGQQSPAVQAFLLEDYLTQFSDLHLTQAQFDEVLTILGRQANYHGHLKSGYWLTKDYTSFAIVKIGQKTEDQVRASVLDYGEHASYGGEEWMFSDLSEEGYLLPSQAPVLLRRAQPGDRLELGGFSKKLSRLFIDEKLPLADRRQAVVVEQDGKIQLIRTRHRTYLRKAEKHAIMKASLIIKKKEW